MIARMSFLASVLPRGVVLVLAPVGVAPLRCPPVLP